MGSTLDVADEKGNQGGPLDGQEVSRGESAYPQIRFFVRSGGERPTHDALFGARMAGYATGEITLGQEALPQIEEGYAWLLWRTGSFFGFEAVEAKREEPVADSTLAHQEKHAPGLRKSGLPTGFLSEPDLTRRKRDWRHKEQTGYLVAGLSIIALGRSRGGRARSTA